MWVFLCDGRIAGVRRRGLALSILLLVILSAVSVAIIGSSQSSFAQSSNLIATINVGSYPSALAYDSSNGNVYVVNTASNDVSVINATTNTVLTNISVGYHPSAVAFDSLNGNIYVTNFGNVSVINGTTNALLTTVAVAVGSYPFAVAFDSSNGYLYVANGNLGCGGTLLGNVTVINGADNAIVATVAVGFNPRGIAFDSSNGDLYVTNVCSGTVSVIEGSSNTVVATVEVGSALGVAFDSLNANVYVAGQGVSVINGSTNTVLTTVSVNSPIHLAFDSLNGYVYVTNLDVSTVSVINGATNAVVANISAGNNPTDLAFDSSNGDLYFSNSGSNTVSVLSSAIYLTSTSSSAPTTSSSTPSSGFAMVVVSSSGQSVEITVTGNISSSEISNMALQENPANNQLSLSFALTGPTGTVGSATITIPKSAVPSGYLPPLVYIDGTLATDQSYYSDQNNYYVMFTTHFSAHEVAIVFSPTASSSTFNTQSTSSLHPTSNISTYEVIGAGAAVIIIAGGGFAFVRRKHS